MSSKFFGGGNSSSGSDSDSSSSSNSSDSSTGNNRNNKSSNLKLQQTAQQRAADRRRQAAFSSSSSSSSDSDNDDSDDGFGGKKSKSKKLKSHSERRFEELNMNLQKLKTLKKNQDFEVITKALDTVLVVAEKAKKQGILGSTTTVSLPDSYYRGIGELESFLLEINDSGIKKTWKKTRALVFNKLRIKIGKIIESNEGMREKIEKINETTKDEDSEELEEEKSPGAKSTKSTVATGTPKTKGADSSDSDDDDESENESDKKADKKVTVKSGSESGSSSDSDKDKKSKTKTKPVSSDSSDSESSGSDSDSSSSSYSSDSSKSSWSSSSSKSSKGSKDSDSDSDIDPDTRQYEDRMERRKIWLMTEKDYAKLEREKKKKMEKQKELEAMTEKKLQKAKEKRDLALREKDDQDNNVGGSGGNKNFNQTSDDKVRESTFNQWKSDVRDPASLVIKVSEYNAQLIGYRTGQTEKDKLTNSRKERNRRGDWLIAECERMCNKETSSLTSSGSDGTKNGVPGNMLNGMPMIRAALNLMIVQQEVSRSGESSSLKTDRLVGCLEKTEAYIDSLESWCQLEDKEKKVLEDFLGRVEIPKRSIGDRRIQFHDRESMLGGFTAAHLFGQVLLLIDQLVRSNYQSLQQKQNTNDVNYVTAMETSVRVLRMVIKTMLMLEENHEQVQKMVASSDSQDNFQLSVILGRLRLHILSLTYYNTHADNLMIFNKMFEMYPESEAKTTNSMKDFLPKQSEDFKLFFEDLSKFCVETILPKVTIEEISNADSPTDKPTIKRHIDHQDNKMCERMRLSAYIYVLFNKCLNNPEDYNKVRSQIHLQDLQTEVESNGSLELFVLFNRLLAQMGLCAFKLGKFKECHLLLLDLHIYQRAKELLSQGVTFSRFGQDRDFERERFQERTQLPYHMHLPLELLESCYLVSAILQEIPSIAQYKFDRSGRKQRYKIFSRTLRMLLEKADKSTVLTPPESNKEKIVTAARALGNGGNWKQCCEYLKSLKSFETYGESMLNIDQVFENYLIPALKEEGLRVYIFNYLDTYKSISLQQLSEQFELPLAKVRQIVTRMIHHNQLSQNTGPKKYDAESLVAGMTVQLDKTSSYLVTNSETIKVSPLQKVLNMLSDRLAGSGTHVDNDNSSGGNNNNQQSFFIPGILGHLEKNVDYKLGDGFGGFNNSKGGLSLGIGPIGYNSSRTGGGGNYKGNKDTTNEGNNNNSNSKNSLRLSDRDGLTQVDSFAYSRGVDEYGNVVRQRGNWNYNKHNNNKGENGNGKGFGKGGKGGKGFVLGGFKKGKGKGNKGSSSGNFNGGDNSEAIKNRKTAALRGWNIGNRAFAI